MLQPLLTNNYIEVCWEWRKIGFRTFRGKRNFWLYERVVRIEGFAWAVHVDVGVGRFDRVVSGVERCGIDDGSSGGGCSLHIVFVIGVAVR